jgi:glycosyltransferase involved in cell wall biosynthesis
MSQVDVSIVIPIYNEEGILREAVGELLEGIIEVKAKLGRPDLRFEILLCENGSRDSTVDLAQHIAAEHSGNEYESAHPIVRTFSLGEPNYGKALRRGISDARGTFVICEEIDLCDRDFHRRALELLLHHNCDFVVGSKVMRGSNDQRPLTRRAATRVINGMLRVALDFRGTDTHGLKAFHRETVMPIVEQCIIDRDLFASELVIRAGREGLRVMEIPVRLEEKRKPSINLSKRIPHVLRGLAQLTYAIRFR